MMLVNTLMLVMSIFQMVLIILKIVFMVGYMWLFIKDKFTTMGV